MKTATNTMGGDTPRVDGDAYLTPDALALAIARRVREAFGGFGRRIVEPSCGEGAFVVAAAATWPRADIIFGDPNDPAVVVASKRLTASGTWPSHAPVSGARWEQDFWTPELRSDPRWGPERALVIGNPPYNLPGDGRGDKPTTAERHALLALDRMRDGDVLAFLLRLAFLGGGGRIERLHAKHPLAALWPVTPRPSFTGGGTDASEYAVFVWRKGHVGPCDLRPLRWSP